MLLKIPISLLTLQLYCDTVLPLMMLIAVNGSLRSGWVDTKFALVKSFEAVSIKISIVEKSCNAHKPVIRHGKTSYVTVRAF